MQATINNVRTGNWCIYTQQPGSIVTDWDAIKQRIIIGVNTLAGTNPLKPYYFSYTINYIDKPVNIAIPNIKKDIVNVISIVAPEISVKKIKHQAETDGSITFTILLSRNQESTSLAFNTLSEFADFKMPETVILEAGTSLNPEGQFVAELTVKPGTILRSSPHFSLKDVHTEISTAWSAYGYFGYSNRTLIGYLKKDYQISQLHVRDVIGLQLLDISTIPPGNIYVTSVVIGPYSDTNEMMFTDINALVAWLEGTFKPLHGLQGIFYYGNNKLYYGNYEEFLAGSVTADTHLHNTIYSLMYN